MTDILPWIPTFTNTWTTTDTNTLPWIFSLVLSVIEERLPLYFESFYMTLPVTETEREKKRDFTLTLV